MNRGTKNETCHFSLGNNTNTPTVINTNTCLVDVVFILSVTSASSLLIFKLPGVIMQRL